MKVFLSVLGSESEKTIDIPSGKTVLGRGPFLGCSDKKVSRNHAVLEVQSNGDIFLTPTHVNPCFYRTASESTLRIIKKDIPQKLQPGDVFSLLPNSFQYEVHQKTPDGKVLPLPNDSLNKGKSNAPKSSEEHPLNTKSEINHSKKLTENGDSTDKTNMQNKNAAPKSEGVKKDEPSKASESESKKTELPKSSFPKSSSSERSSQQKSSETPSDANSPLSNSCGGKSPKASQLSGQRRRTLPDWLIRSAATASKGAKNSNNGLSVTNNATDDKKGVSNTKNSKISSTTTISNNNNRVNSTGRSYTGRQNRQTIQKISLDDFVVSDDEEVQWKSPDESDDSSRSKSRRGGGWRGRGGKRDSDSGSDWEMENRKSKKNWRSNEASSGSDWETSRTTASQKKKRGRPQRRKSYNSDSGSDWEVAGNKRRSNRRKAAPVTRRPRRNAKRKASSSEELEEDEDVRSESEVDKKKTRKRKSKKPDESDEVEDEKSTKSSPARSEGGRKREPCLYAKKCYRKNASHFDVYSHPGDSDYTSPKEEDDEEEGEEEVEKKDESEKKETKKEKPMKECPYGIDCFRKNPQHKKEFKHTKKVRPTREASKKSSKYNDIEEEEDISMEESDEYDPAKEIAD